MRIVLVTGIFPPDIGGPATYVPHMAAALTERGHTVTVVTLSDSLAHDDSGYSFDLWRIQRPQPHLLRLLTVVRRIAGIARSSDVILANGLILESALASRLTGTPLVAKVAGDWAWERSHTRGWTHDTLETFQQRQASFPAEVLKLVRTWTLQQAVGVVTPSQYLRRMVQNWGIHLARLYVITNTPALAASTEGTAPSIIPPFAGATLVTIGRLLPRKGIDRLICVVARLPGVRLVVVGDGPQRTTLEALVAALRLEQRVMFVGSVPSAHVTAYLHAADIFVLNSTCYEGLPHTVLEAMQAGVPVVATDVGGTGEIITHAVTGMLVPPQDDEQLLRTLTNLLNHPAECARLARAGFEHVRTAFGWDTMVTATEKLLQRISEHHTSGSRPCGVLFLGGTRYSRPLDHTHAAKFQALAALRPLYVIGFTVGIRPLHFHESAHFLLLPQLPLPVLRYLEVATAGTLLVFWHIICRQVRVIIAQSPYEGVAAAMALSLARICGRQAALVIESHGDFEASLFLQRSLLLPHLYRFVMQHTARFALRHATVLRAVSRSTRTQLEHWCKHVPIVEFPAWTDLGVFFTAGQTAPTRTQRILYAGVLIQRKGVHHLVQAFAMLAQDYPDASLVLVGDSTADPAYTRRLHSLVEQQGLAERVRFVQPVAQSDLATMMQQACVLVMPSLSEGLGRVIFEAMVTGTPVIGSQVGGIPELIEDGVTGWLVPPGDEIALSERLRSVLAHPEQAQRMGRQAHQKAKQHFSSADYVANYARLFALAEQQMLQRSVR